MKNIIYVIVLTVLTTVPLAAQKGLVKVEFEWEDYERHYYVHLPPAEKLTQAVPLLFHLHGGGGTAKRTPRLTYNQFNLLADREGFIVIYPQGIEKQWNDGRKSDHVKAWREDIDDVGFISEIVNRTSQEYNIDMNKIFSTGMSNGGFMSSRLACERSDLFRGVAIVTAQISEDYFPNCKPNSSLGVLIMNGTDDPLVPYNGGEIEVLKKKRGTILSTDDYVKFWLEKNNCETESPVENLPNSNTRDGSTVSKTIYSNCSERGALQLYTVNGGGHTWPGGKQYWTKRMIGTTNRDINACNVIWDFFKSLD